MTFAPPAGILNFMFKRSPTWLLTLALAAAAVAAFACDTPVYRYAMYRWQPAPYEVYCFSRGELSAEAKELEAKAQRLASAVKLGTNVSFVTVDLEKDPELKTVPPEIAALFKQAEAKDRETFLVISPLGRQVFRGSLNAATFEEMIDSPARRKIGEQLARGHASVFLLLANSDKEAGEKAEGLLAEIAADVRSGKLELYVAPENSEAKGDRPEEAAEPGERLPVPRAGGKKKSDDAAKPAAASDAKPAAEISVIVVRRDDPKEAWLVRQLLAVEPDLPGRDQPMIFPCFGRARVMPPLIGKGISRKNLEEALHYVTGACVCTVRDQNPGIDLLTRFDWGTAAEKMAARHSSEEGARFALRDLQLFSEPGQVEAPAKSEEGPATKELPGVDMPIASDAQPMADIPPRATDSKGDSKEPETQPGAIVAPTPTTPTRDLLLWLGGGLVAAILIVGGATWWLLRGHS